MNYEAILCEISKKSPLDTIQRCFLWTLLWDFWREPPPSCIAGTVYGETWVSELFFHMYTKVQKTVVLGLNPLNALKYNQVSIKNSSRLKTLTHLGSQWFGFSPASGEGTGKHCLSLGHKQMNQFNSQEEPPYHSYDCCFSATASLMTCCTQNFKSHTLWWIV